MSLAIDSFDTFFYALTILAIVVTWKVAWKDF